MGTALEVEPVPNLMMLGDLARLCRQGPGLVRALLQEPAVAVRIDTDFEGSTAIVRVAGRLSGDGVEELMKHCRSLRPDFVLDLSQLRSADDAGVSAIRSLVRDGAPVRGDSPFIRLLLSNG